MHRTDAIDFDLGIFTNIEPDHIGPNEHESFEHYMACKSLLFRQCKVGIVNGDDPHAQTVLQGHTCSVETYGLEGERDLKADNITLVKTPGCLGVDFDVTGLTNMHVSIPTPGRFSVYNALCAIAVCRHFQIHEDDVQKALLAAKVKGRIEMIPISEKFTLMIDYAHNGMALRSLLKTLKEYDPKRIVCLFGCGGNRAKDRRYEMGEASGEYADLSIITSDNPRFEDPQAIIDDIKVGIGRTSGKYVEIIDRKEAIAYAIENAEDGDVIVLAGKGHEDYQEIKGKKYPMDERVLIEEILQEGVIPGSKGNGGKG
jgi:UDP-N-acetylmuramoyl-L-alanyl-D-glutamate--2,6-diaminopimelate ligase